MFLHSLTIYAVHRIDALRTDYVRQILAGAPIMYEMVLPLFKILTQVD
ncbi:hypothetical protein NBRC116493_00210 [Aurantivibrio infirmus]